MHEVLVNRLGGLSLPRKSVVRLTDRPDMTLYVTVDVKRQCNNENNNTDCLPVSFPRGENRNIEAMIYHPHIYTHHTHALAYTRTYTKDRQVYRVNYNLTFALACDLKEAETLPRLEISLV